MLQGKLEITSRVRIANKDDLSRVYTPGVAGDCLIIAKNKEASFDYTLRGRTVAVISDGSAVLGLGNIGPEAALPVMEGKCLLLKKFAGIDAFPLCIDSQKTEDIISFVKMIAPTFAAINLEDISAPRCFEIEEALQNIGIPVMHDDQHATAMAILGPLQTAVELSGKKWSELKVVICGVGAAGTAVCKMLSDVCNIILVDSKGIIYKGRPGLEEYKQELSGFTNKNNRKGDLETALEGTDVFIGLSAPGILKTHLIKKMADDPIIFALANPVPEIMPDLAKKAGVRFYASGRSDFPNQINNALIFPGFFKGLIKSRAKKITPTMKIKAARALGSIIQNPTPENFVPSIFDPRVVKAVSQAVNP